jgi:hypothetical protein
MRLHDEGRRGAQTKLKRRKQMKTKTNVKAGTVKGDAAEAPLL